MSGFARLGSLVSWGVVPAILLAQFFDLRRGVTGQPSQLSVYFLLFAAITVVTLPWVVANRRDISRTGRVIGVAWFGLIAFALVSSLTTTLPSVRPPAQPVVAVPRSALVWPVATALVTSTAAWGLVMAAPAAQRHARVLGAAVTLVASTLIAGPRTMLARSLGRLGTGLGGAAVLHVALLVALGVLLGAVVQPGRTSAGSRRGTAWWTCVIGAGVACGEVLLTLSRAGWACLALFVMVVFFVLGKKIRKQLAIAGAVVVFVAILVLLVVPQARRLLSLADAGRSMNMRGGFSALGTHWWNWLLGAGEGRVWPWYVFDAGLSRPPWLSRMTTDFGTILSNPHSLFFGVLVELGLVGLAAILVIAGMLVFRLVVTLWTGTRATFIPRLAVVCTLPAMFVDYYLLKNYGVSFVWWFVVAGYFGVRARRARDVSEDNPALASEPAAEATDPVIDTTDPAASDTR